MPRFKERMPEQCAERKGDIAESKEYNMVVKGRENDWNKAASSQDYEDGRRKVEDNAPEMYDLDKCVFGTKVLASR